MSKFIVVVLPTETKAYEATLELKALHDENSLTVYNMAVIAKSADGLIAVKETDDHGPFGIGLGAVVGGLIGVFGGPAGLIAGVAGGALLGSMNDLFNLGLSAKFIEKISTELAPGKSAVIAEIDEVWQTPLDTRMETLGGIVLRNWRGDFEDEQIALVGAAAKANYQHLKTEYAHATAQAKAGLEARLSTAKAEFDATEHSAKKRVEVLEEELKAKVTTLEKQMKGAETDSKDKIVKQIATLKADYTVRSTKLKEAWQLTKDALAA